MGDFANSDAPLLLKRAKHGKAPGILAVARRLLTWTPSDPGSHAAVVELAVATITNQQRAKGKPCLRFSNSGKPLVFEFDGMADVDTVVQVIAPLLQSLQIAAPKAAPDAQAALKRSLLQSDRDLEALHSQLVVRGVLTDDEFWKGRASLLSAGLPSVQQRVGLTSAMLAESQHSADGQSDTIKIKLTATMVHQIFAEKPAVMRAFQATVPTRMMTSQQFWAKYLKHQVLSQNARRREAARLPPEPAFLDGEEFFGKYERDSDDMPSATAGNKQCRSAVDDLASDQNDNLTPGYGIYHDSRKDADQVKTGIRQKKGLIRDINRHAEVVMGGIPDSLPADAEAAAAVLAAEMPQDTDPGGSRHQAATDKNGAGSRGSAYGGSNLDDLRAVQPPVFSELPIKDTRGAFKIAINSSEDGGPAPMALDYSSVAKAALESLGTIDTMRLNIHIPSDGVMQVLTCGMHRGGLQGAAAQALSPQQVSHLRQLALAANELLRHFWACQPASTAQRQAKVNRIISALKQHFERLEDAESASQGAERGHARQLLRPVKDAITAAYEAMSRSSGSTASTAAAAANGLRQ